MNIKTRIDKLSKKINKNFRLTNIHRGLRPRTLEDYMNNTLEATYVPELKKGVKKLEDFL